MSALLQAAVFSKHIAALRLFHQGLCYGLNSLAAMPGEQGRLVGGSEVTGH